MPGRDDFSTTHTLLVDEIPDPIPLSCLQKWSGDPMARERMGCQRETPGGKSDLWIRRPFEVPPRAKEAGKLAVILLLLPLRARFWLLGHDLGADGFVNTDAGL